MDVHSDRSKELSAFDGGGLLALLDLIQGSVIDILSIYQSVGVPLRSLDDSSTEPGPFDDIQDTTPRLRHSIATVQSACDQLCATISCPPITLLNVRDLVLIFSISADFQS